MIAELRLLGSLPRDGYLLLATRAVRLLAYGALSVVLALYLAALGLGEVQIGYLLTDLARKAQVLPALTFTHKSGYGKKSVKCTNTRASI